MRLSVSRVCARRVSSSFRSASSRVRSSEYARRSCARALGSDSIRRPGPRAPLPAFARIAPSVPPAPPPRFPLPASPPPSASSVDKLPRMVLERFQLEGKVAVVTGAGRGLGRQMALALADAGADVVCAARTKEQIERTAADIEALGRRAAVQPTDVRDSRQCDAMIQRAVDQFGRIDVMLSNAGIGDMRGANSELWAVADDDWRDTIDVNLSSAFYCARAASKQMIAEGHAGTIINVASGPALRAH